jgi:hypothetical protein
MTTPLTAAQRAVVLSGVPVASSAGPAQPPADQPVPIAHDELNDLIGWATRERLGGLLWRAWDSGELSVRADGSSAPIDVAAALDEALLAGMRSSLAAEATGLAAVVALRSAGIDAVLFKGLANAHLDYGDPIERTFFDADILVPRPDLSAAIAALSDAGFGRGAPRMRPAWERRFARAVELRHVCGAELDLHLALATGYFGVILDHDQLRRDRVQLEFGGVDCLAFGPTSRMLISCYAIVLSRGPGIRLYGDLARQLLVSGADWRYAADLAGPGECVIAEALRRLGTVLDIEHESIEWAQAVVPSRTAGRALDYAVVGERDGWSADARSALLAMGMFDRARFLTGIAESRLRRR